jgi:GNAT superfamily N-acetyltransferase
MSVGKGPAERVPGDDLGWFELVLGNQPALWRIYAEVGHGELIAEEGVQATVIPGSPKRSFFNSVFYDDAERLIARLLDLAEAYEQAGVRAWTVWVPASDERTGEALAEAGHKLDAEPRAMGLALEELRMPDPDSALEIRTGMDMPLVLEINEIAYGYAAGDFPPMDPLPGMQLYQGHLDGEVVGTTVIWDRGVDCEISMVATLPEARGHGIAGRVLARALADARERGQRASTLIATKLGYPVYEKLGYRDVGGLQMWERREA